MKNSKDYYNKIHEKLAKKYKTTSEMIKYVRTIAIGQRLEGAAIVLFLKNKIKGREPEIKNLINNVNKNKNAINFIVNLSAADFEDIINTI